MRGWCVLLSGVIMSTSGLPMATVAQAQPVQTVTLDGAMASAIERHPSVAVAARALDAARARLAQAKAGPALQISLGARTTTGTLSVTGTPTGGAPTSSSSVSVDATLPLYDGGITALQVAQAEAGVDAAAAAFEAARQDAALSAAQAYFQVLRAVRVVEIREAAVRSTQRQVQQAEAFLRAGTAARADVIKAQAAAAGAAADLVAARGDVEVALAVLRSAMGLSLTQLIVVVEPSDLVLLPISPAEAASEAGTRRAEVRRTGADVRSAQTALRIAEIRASVLISIDATGVIQAVPNPGQAGWEVSATFSYPIFDGGRTKAAVEEARANLAAAMARAEVAARQVQLQAVQASINTRESAARLEAFQVSVAAADESQRVAEGRYTAGVGTLLEALDAETAATQARINQVQARFDLHLSTITLRHALGRTLVERRSAVGLAV